MPARLGLRAGAQRLRDPRHQRRRRDRTAVRRPDRRFRDDAGSPFVILGTRHRDRITGTNRSDRILLFAGDDRAEGGRGNDCIDGGRGRDTESGALGHDRLFGGPGGDTINAGFGRDRIAGGRGNDRINAATAGPRSAAISCGAGFDKIRVNRNERRLARRGRARCERVYVIR